jgi:hypothetical protein
VCVCVRIQWHTTSQRTCLRSFPGYLKWRSARLEFATVYFSSIGDHHLRYSRKLRRSACQALPQGLRPVRAVLREIPRAGSRGRGLPA